MKSLRPWKQTDVASSSKPKKFVKATMKDLIIHAHKKIGRFRFVDNAYMEDNFRDMFVKKTKEISIYKLNLIEDWPSRKKYQWKCAMNEARQSREVLDTTHKVSRIVSVSKRSCTGFKIFELEVTRTNGKFYTLSEADFPHMLMRDVDAIYSQLKEMVGKTGLYQDLEYAIRRFMKYKINDMCCHDFQMGMECGQEILNLTPPVQETRHSHLGGIMFEVKLENNKVGIYYPNEANERKFMFMDELHKYSDGTLKIIHTNLASQIVISDYMQADLNSNESRLYQQRMILLLQRAVRNLLNDRVHVRAFEEYFGLRDK